MTWVSEQAKSSLTLSECTRFPMSGVGSSPTKARHLSRFEGRPSLTFRRQGAQTEHRQPESVSGNTRESTLESSTPLYCGCPRPARTLVSVCHPHGQQDQRTRLVAVRPSLHSQVGTAESSLSALAMAWSRFSTACWYRSAAAEEECPRRAISSFVLAPARAASVAPVCLRSWRCTPDNSARSVARFHASYSDARRTAWPFVPTNTRSL
jgi:hypothetical protein